MRLEERRLLKWGLVLFAVGVSLPVLYLAFLFVFGSQQAPRPVADATPAPPLVKDALWARAEGGRAAELRPINPVNMIGYAGCSEANGPDCSTWLPALRGIEYLASLHLRDNQVERASFRGGAGAMSLTLFITHSWTRDDFLNTLAARADFGYAWRGVEAASQGFYGRAAADLTLPQAAFLASRVGNTRGDPWCAPDESTRMRNRVLETMRNNGVIDDTKYREASVVSLELVSPPAGHHCGQGGLDAQ